MGARRIGHAVGCNHDRLAGDAGVDPFLAHHVDDDHTAFLAIAFERVCRQSLPGVLPLDVCIADVAEPLLPAFIEERTFQRSRPGRIGVEFGSDVVTTCLSGFDEIDGKCDITQRHAVDVHDVQRRAGDCCVGNHLLNAGNSGISYVDKNWRLNLSGKFEEAEYFLTGSSGLIAHK